LEKRFEVKRILVSNDGAFLKIENDEEFLGETETVQEAVEIVDNYTKNKRKYEDVTQSGDFMMLYKVIMYENGADYEIINEFYEL